MSDFDLGIIVGGTLSLVGFFADRFIKWIMNMEWKNVRK